MKKDKYQQIFNYLHEFSKIRSKPVRDIEYQDTHYPEKFWLDEIPEDDLFENVIRDSFNPDSEYWIKVKKPKEPEKPTFPPLSKTLESWIEPDSLIDDEEEPVLKESVERQGKLLLIEDKPEIQKEFDEYVNTKWIDDLITYKTDYSNYEKEYEIFEFHNNIYKSLFRIYNKAQQFGEEFELVIGIGLLNFKENDETPKIFRHIFTQRVEINFEYSERDSQILINPTIESTPQIESDSIIDLVEQFDSQNIIDAEREVEKYINEKGISHLFTNGLIKDAIQIFADRFSPDGRFVDKLEKPSNTENKPTIYFSPALLLRKRNTRSFTALYENILEKIEEEPEEIEIPTIDDLIDIDNVTDSERNTVVEEIITPKFESIYFPKEHNDEQKEIIEKARRNNKVLVQGPPGTGKSHTIANLICHLLATGNKVLITAYTKRALEVLKDKLPIEFQNLAVNLLSGDSSSIKDLQASVNAINDELSRGNVNQYSNEIDQLNLELDEIRKKIASITNELINIKEKSIRSHDITEEYSGTLTEIAEKIEQNSISFSWYTDSYCSLVDDEIQVDLQTFIELHNLYNQIDVSEFDKWIPDIENLPSVNEIAQYRNAKETFFELSPKFELNSIECPDYQLVKNKLEEVQEFYKKFDSKESNLIQSLLDSYLNGNSYLWHHKIEQSAKILARIQEINLEELKYNVKVSYNTDKDLISLKNDARVLLNYINQGNKLSGASFKVKKRFLPKEINEKFYFIESVLVNGSPCDTINEFEQVINDIELKQDFQELSDIWETDIIPKSSSYDKKFLFFKNYHEEVIKLISILDKFHQRCSELEPIINQKIEPFNKTQIEKLINDIELSRLQNVIGKTEALISSSEKYLKQPNSHPIAAKLISQLQQIDPISYEITLKELNAIKEGISKYQEFKTLELKLREKVPNLADKILSNDFVLSQLKEFPKALKYRYTQKRIQQLFDINYEKQLFVDLKDSENKEKKLISRVASKLAWKYVIEGLQNNRALRQYLEAWVQAVKKIGKTGKGKRALKFRKEAQIQMEKCKSSVPCWIMPLYKVAETIQPEQGMYDYAIIDEASQLGPDAIFLLYISKNIIIVGDDKQTSPEYIGVDPNTMTPFIKRHLKDIPFANYYGTEFSFFDHARRFCDGITVLREHFRCMPEIIEFSNKHFYARDNIGLYPLKQYSENRLEPLQSVFCPDGYIEGNRSRIINKPEAEKIVEVISSLISKDEYFYFDKQGKKKPKTMGIIALQGNQQAALIENMLLKAIGEQEYHNRKIVCGNSASFQGDERDIMILSLVTAHNHNRSTLSKPEDERRFNVAVSRAIEQIWLFHSVQLEDLSNKGDLRFKLLEHFKNPIEKPPILNSVIERKPGSQPEPFDSWFEVDVYNEIVTRGYSVIPQYEVAKGRYIIDLVAIFPDGTKIAIECDGDKWHGAEQYQNDLLRQKILERCGWQFFRIRGYEFYTDRIKTLEPLWKIFSKYDTPDEREFEEKASEDNQNNTETKESSYREEKTSTEPEKEKPTTENSANAEKQVEGTILRYFNLFNSGNYTITDEKPLEADYIIPIKSTQKNGYLLQCYESGHINKVYIKVLLAKRIGKEYMNGLNTNDKLLEIKIIESEKIIGIYFIENRERKFKAHLSEKISCREQLHLQGYKVMYNDFEKIEYKILPLEIKGDLSRLIFNSFTANGKPTTNKYYDKEWSILEKFSSKEKDVTLIEEEDDNFMVVEKVPPRTRTLFDKKVTLDCTVKLKYLNKNKIVTIQFVDYETKGKESHGEIQKMYNKSPIANWINGKSVGDTVRLGDSDYYVEILDVL